MSLWQSHDYNEILLCLSESHHLSLPNFRVKITYTETACICLLASCTIFYVQGWSEVSKFIINAMFKHCRQW